MIQCKCKCKSHGNRLVERCGNPECIAFLKTQPKHCTASTAICLPVQIVDDRQTQLFDFIFSSTVKDGCRQSRGLATSTSAGTH